MVFTLYFFTVQLKSTNQLTTQPTCLPCPTPSDHPPPNRSSLPFLVPANLEVVSGSSSIEPPWMSWYDRASASLALRKGSTLEGIRNPAISRPVDIWYTFYVYMVVFYVPGGWPEFFHQRYLTVCP